MKTFLQAPKRIMGLLLLLKKPAWRSLSKHSYSAKHFFSLIAPYFLTALCLLSDFTNKGVGTLPGLFTVPHPQMPTLCLAYTRICIPVSGTPLAQVTISESLAATQ